MRFWELSGTCHHSGPMPPGRNVDPIMPTLLIFPEKPAMWIFIRTLLLMKWFHKLRSTQSTHALSYQEVIRMATAVPTSASSLWSQMDVRVITVMD